jgi:hypothetical protein
VSNLDKWSRNIDGARGCRPSGWATALHGFGGAFAGYAALTILANLEPWDFYTIRSALTGETAMSRIIEHPADRWIILGLFISFIFGGAFAGFWIARLNARTCRRDEVPETHDGARPQSS